MMELKNRKTLRLAGYDYNENGLYFLTICVKNKEKILCKIVGDGVLDVPKIILSPYGKIVEKYILSINNTEKISVHKYVIMPDHIHLLIFVDNYTEGPLHGTSRTPSPTNALVPHMVSTFKRFCNKEIGLNIWQRGFYDHIIRNEQDYIKHYNYIETNPLLWEKERHEK